MVGRFVGQSAWVSISRENKHVMKKEVLWIICLGGMDGQGIDGLRTNRSAFT